MERYQLRFDDAKTAKMALTALRRRGFKVFRKHVDLFIASLSYKEIDVALKSWALRRGELPEWFVIDVKKL